MPDLTLHDIQGLLPDTIPDSFCLAPFISTMQTPYGKTSPCAYGVTEWQLGDLEPRQRWDHTLLNHMRADFAQGVIPQPCMKCINEEKSDKSSLRLRMREWFPDAYDDMVLSGRWQSGPMLLSTKVSNVCNLACRSCAGWDSNSFRDEGRHYLEVYDTQHPGTPGNRFIPRLAPKHTDYNAFADISANITKLEFFGGEPLLNLSHLDLLEHLVSTGQSSEVTIFYSTNCTQPVNARLKRIWSRFRAIEFSLSIDHIGDKFEYLRWPAKWDQVQRNIHHYMELSSELGIDMRFVVSSCATLNNAYYIDEVIDWANTTVGASYINMVAAPLCLSLHVAPDYVKQAVLDHVQNAEVRGFINLHESDPLEWKRWIIWNKRQDLYRRQDFTDVFPEFYQIIKPDWDSVTDLSEINFNQREEG